jgi:hypothetical protein
MALTTLPCATALACDYEIPQRNTKIENKMMLIYDVAACDQLSRCRQCTQVGGFFVFVYMETENEYARAENSHNFGHKLSSYLNHV